MATATDTAGVPDRAREEKLASARRQVGDERGSEAGRETERARERESEGESEGEGGRRRVGRGLTTLTSLTLSFSLSLSHTHTLPHALNPLSVAQLERFQKRNHVIPDLMATGSAAGTADAGPIIVTGLPAAAAPAPVPAVSAPVVSAPVPAPAAVAVRAPVAAVAQSPTKQVGGGSARSARAFNPF